MSLLGLYNKDTILCAIRITLNKHFLIQAKAGNKVLDSADSKRKIKSSVRS